MCSPSDVHTSKLITLCHVSTGALHAIRTWRVWPIWLFVFPYLWSSFRTSCKKSGLQTHTRGRNAVRATIQLSTIQLQCVSASVILLLSWLQATRQPDTLIRKRNSADHRRTSNTMPHSSGPMALLWEWTTTKKTQNTTKYVNTMIKGSVNIQGVFDGSCICEHSTHEHCNKIHNWLHLNQQSHLVWQHGEEQDTHTGTEEIRVGNFHCKENNKTTKTLPQHKMWSLYILTLSSRTCYQPNKQASSHTHKVLL